MIPEMGGPMIYSMGLLIFLMHRRRVSYQDLTL
jgi:hypothetical protein